MINECLSEILGPFPVPPARDKRKWNDDPGQKGRGHLDSVHPSNYAIAVDDRDRRSAHYLDHSHRYSPLCRHAVATTPVGSSGQIARGTAYSTRFPFTDDFGLPRSLAGRLPH